MSEVNKFINQVTDPKLAKYLRFRYVGYEQRLEQDKEFNAQSSRERTMGAMEVKRTNRACPA